MLASKTFVKKTKKGAVVKVVREHYLRDDVWCGVIGCKLCSQQDDKPPVLERCPDILSEICNFPHLVLPDTNVVLHQTDFLQNSVIKNVVILQTVLQETKHQNLSVHQRIRDMISDPSKKFYVFANEHHKETFVEREPKESANDRNDRAIRIAAQWYSKHLAENFKTSGRSGTVTQIVLITDDRDNCRKAKDIGLHACTVFDYASSLKDCPGIIDHLASSSENGGSFSSQKEKILYSEHLPLSVIQSGLKTGRYLQGNFQGSRENYLEGYVSVFSMEKRLLVRGRQNLNRAVHDDIVAIELLPEEEWTAPSGVIMRDIEREGEEEEAEEEVEASEERKVKEVVGTGKEEAKEKSGVKEGKVTKKNLAKKPLDKSQLQPTAKIVGIIKRNWRPYCGTLLPRDSMKGIKHTFVPAERRIPRVYLDTRQGLNLIGKRIIVSIDAWPRSSRFPHGHFVRELGEIGDKNTENEVLLLEHDVPHQSFSTAVLADLPQMPWFISEDEYKKRSNLRYLDVCSVDPPGCTDIDDALHSRELENGNLEVGVHIADVSHFIRPNTALDKEAANRGTTVYLADMRIDMVPELLSSNLCSLRGGEERLAFSCLWEMTADAEIVSTRFVKSVIRSRAALTYAEAQLRISEPERNDAVTISLRRLNKLAKILKASRIEKGALTLASPEVRFEVDSETHDPIDLQTKEMMETNSLVEEFMLLANISVAKHIHENFPHCALLRRHPAPPLSNYDILIKACDGKGVSISVDSAKSLATSLDQATLPDQPYFNTMLRIMATRCMMQAVYFCSGTLPTEEFHHYGLAMPIYTHFTSPIRRYSDLIVHRLLAVAVTADKTYPELLDKHKAQILCNHLNHRHKMAQYAARASIRLHTQLFFKGKAPVEEGFVLFVHHNALQVLIPKYGLETMLFFDDHSQKKSNSKSKLSIIPNDGEPSLEVQGVIFRLFDRLKVKVQVEKCSIQQSKLTLQLISPKVPGMYLSNDSEEFVPPAKRVKLV